MATGHGLSATFCEHAQVIPKRTRARPWRDGGILQRDSTCFHTGRPAWEPWFIPGGRWVNVSRKQNKNTGQTKPLNAGEMRLSLRFCLFCGAVVLVIEPKNTFYLVGLRAQEGAAEFIFAAGVSKSGIPAMAAGWRAFCQFGTVRERCWHVRGQFTIITPTPPAPARHTR